MAVGGGGGGGSSGIRAGRAFVELFSKDNMLYRGLARAQKAVESFGKLTVGIGAAGFAAGGAVLGTVAALFQRVAEKRKGLTADEAGRLAMGGNAIKAAWEGVETIFGRLVAALLPSRDTIRQLYAAVMAGIATTRGWIDANAGLVRGVVLGAAALAAGGAALVAFGVAASAAATAVGVAVAAVKLLAGAVGLLLTPAGLAVAAVAGLGYLFATQTATGKRWASAVGGYFREMAGTATTAWGGIVDAIKGGNLAIAGQVALAALNVEWRRGLLLLRQGWEGFKEFFADGWDSVVYLFGTGVNAFTAATKTAAVDVIDYLKREYGAFFKFVAEQSAKVLDAVGDTRGAEAFRLLGGSSAEKVAQAAAAVRRKVNAEQVAADAKLAAAMDAKKAERQAAASTAVELAESELFKARADLDALVAQAAAAANKPRAAGGVGLDDAVTAARAAGTFDASRAAQAFGQGDIGRAMVAEQKRANELAGGIGETLGRLLKAVESGGRFG